MTLASMMSASISGQSLTRKRLPLKALQKMQALWEHLSVTCAGSSSQPHWAGETGVVRNAIAVTS